MILNGGLFMGKYGKNRYKNSEGIFEKMVAKEFRIESISIIVGGFLVLIATFLHPPLVDPYNGAKAIHQFSHCNIWMEDHVLMLCGIVCWLLGLAGCKPFISSQHKASTMAAALCYISLCLWIMILTTELTILPVLGAEMKRPYDVYIAAVWKAAFSFGLLAGYFAVACSWLAIILYGCAMKKSGHRFSNWFTNGTIFFGLLGFIGIIVTCFSFHLGYVILPLTSGPVFLWTMWLGYRAGFANIR